MTSKSDFDKVVFQQYRRKQIAELADWQPEFDMAGVSISDADIAGGSPKAGDKIARNPVNHADKWLVAADYFAANFEQCVVSVAAEPVAWAVPNSRPTERNPFMQVLLDKTSAQYPELLVPLYAASAPAVEPALFPTPEVQLARRAIACLYVELPEAVARDFQGVMETAFQSLLRIPVETAGSAEVRAAALEEAVTIIASRLDGYSHNCTFKKPTETCQCLGCQLRGTKDIAIRALTPAQCGLTVDAPDSAVPVALTFDAFRAANVARCIKWHPAGIESWSPSDWLVAVTGELGELASLLKMRNRERDELPGNKFSPTNKQVADELADVLTYLDLLAAVLGVDLGRAAVSKFNEVSERVGFPDRIPLYSVPTSALSAGLLEAARIARSVYDDGRASGMEGTHYQQGWEAASERVENELRSLADQPTKMEQPKCLGYPHCDGDLVGETHEPDCPMYVKPRKPWKEFLAEARKSPEYAAEIAALKAAPRTDLRELLREAREYVAATHTHHFVSRVKGSATPLLQEPCSRCNLNERLLAAIDALTEERGKVVEDTEWGAEIEGEKIFVQSADFKHDVRLYVNGDFESITQNFEYAEQIAKQLNALAAKPSAEPADVALRVDRDNATRIASDLTLAVGEQRTEILWLRDLLAFIREYPDFDKGGIYADAIDEALAGRRPTILGTIDAIASGYKPAAPSSEAQADEFYVQNGRDYVGNDMLFWATAGGYTTDLSKAQVFTKDAALKQQKMRSTDFAWPKQYIDSKSRPAVDFQYVTYADATATMPLPAAPAKGKEP